VHERRERQYFVVEKEKILLGLVWRNEKGKEISMNRDLPGAQSSISSARRGKGRGRTGSMKLKKKRRGQLYFFGKRRREKKKKNHLVKAPLRHVHLMLSNKGRRQPARPEGKKGLGPFSLTERKKRHCSNRLNGEETAFLGRGKRYQPAAAPMFRNKKKAKNPGWNNPYLKRKERGRRLNWGKAQRRRTRCHWSEERTDRFPEKEFVPFLREERG